MVNNKETTVSLWGRLGVQIDMTPEEFEVLKKGGEAACNLLVNLIKSDRCFLNGDTYFPPDCNEKYLSDDWGFDIGFQSIHKDAEVDIEAFREELSEIYGFDVSALSNEQIVEKYKALQDRLAGDDVYTAIYTDAVYDVFGKYSSEEIENNPEIKALRGEISNLRHELDGALIYDSERAPKIEKCLAVRELELDAALEGVELNLDPDDIIDAEHLDCFWYGGQIGTLEYKGYTVSIEVHGEVRLTVLDEDMKTESLHYINKNNSGAYEDSEVKELITDDETLHKLRDEGRAVWSNNNWVEYRIFEPSGEEIDTSGWDNVLDDNVLEVFADVNYYKEIIDNLALENDKEVTCSTLADNIAIAKKQQEVQKQKQTQGKDREDNIFTH